MPGFLQRAFHRNAAARDNLEVLLVSAASSLLLLRFGLYASGYPQVGGGSLHIAHMLYGGLLLLAAVVILLGFLGKRASRLGAFIGGAGFGIFIDELGKFITRDNNYFFRPTVGIIYAIFIILYLLFNFISRSQTMTSREYQLNALSELQEAVLHDMDASEKRYVAELLSKADQEDEITKQLQYMLAHTHSVHDRVGFVQRYRRSALKSYQHFWGLRGSSQAISLIFVAEALIFVVVIFVTIAANINDFVFLKSTQSYGQGLLIGQLASSVVAAVFAIIGAVTLPRARMVGFEWFRRATLVTIFLTEFFVFTRVQFGAMPGFIINILLLGSLNFAITQERRTKKRSVHAEKLTA